MPALKLITETHPTKERQTVAERVYGTLEGHACDSVVRMSQQRLVALTGASVRGVQHAARGLLRKLNEHLHFGADHLVSSPSNTAQQRPTHHIFGENTIVMPRI